MTKGIFQNVNEAVSAAKVAFSQFQKLGLSEREEIIKELRAELLKYVDELAQDEMDETFMGILADKKEKLRIAIMKTPGTEDLVTEVLTGDHAMTLYESSPYGVACAILPSTNPCGTMINNCISLLAAGNSIINCPHPRALQVSKKLNGLMSKIVSDICGIDNLIVTLDTCQISMISEIMNHPDVDMIVATGGSEVARIANKCGKKVFSAGAGNPTFIVDETAKLEQSAHFIVKGASFDNNIMCITEKNIIVVQDVIDDFKKALEKEDVLYIDKFEDMIKLSKVLLTEDLKPNKLMGGKDVNTILRKAGIECDKNYKLIAVETVKIHPFVTEELLMPLITIVVVKDFEEALKTALLIEEGLFHTAGIHSTKIERLNRAAKILKTALFIKNGCSLNGIGFDTEGSACFTIANKSGEGSITARNFTRKRRCVLVDGFSIR